MNDLNNKPGYQRLRESGELSIRVARARQIISCCTLCPRRCNVNRLDGEIGFCGAGNFLEVANSGPHFGEEPPISGERGAGAVFFAHCALRCCFCQNYQTSQEGAGYFISEEQLAAVMMDLQDMGCHNINLVTPTHYIPFILKAVYLAAENGLHIPLIYNCSGYESLETLKLLDGIIDIYLPDWKYGEEKTAGEYSRAFDYPSVCRSAVKEMHRQVGDIRLDEKGIAQRGLIVRHLVLPNHRSNSERVLSLIVRTLSPSIRTSLMSQYVPTYQAHRYPRLNRSLLPDEYGEVRKKMEDFDFEEYWIQELESSESCLPDFKKKDPFPHQLLTR